MGLVWRLYGFGMGFVSVKNMGLVWVLYGFSVSLVTGLVWVWYKFCMELAWFLYGFVWYGFDMGFV